MNRFRNLITILFFITFATFQSHALDPVNWRGGNITCDKSTILSESDVKIWKSWGINIVRINFNKDDLTSATSGPSPTNDISAPYTQSLAQLDNWLNWLTTHDIAVIVSLDYLWGDDHSENSIMWQNDGDNQYLRHRVYAAQSIAAWLKEKHPRVQCLELWNEPYPYNDIYKTTFLPYAIKAVRAVNQNITLSVMPPGEWGDLQYFKNWNGIDDPNTIYSTHIYSPWTYTHQGLYENSNLETSYPGTFKNFPTDTKLYDCNRETALEHVQDIVDFQERTGKKVFVTEFGVVRWAKGNENYLADLISVFEEKGINWITHNIAGWNGWNHSHNADVPADSVNNNPFGDNLSPAHQKLREGWQLNVK